MHLVELPPTEYACVQDLLAPLADNLSLACLLAGEAPGRVFVDSPARPSSALVEIKYHLFLAGNPAGERFLGAANALITGTLIPQARAAGRDGCLAHCPGSEWEGALAVVLDGLDPQRWMRQYFACETRIADWRELLPAGFELLPVDAALAERADLSNIDLLREEMCSERPSVGDFLARSFGFCLRKDDAVVGWCLSEYNTSGRCEVGIAVMEDFRRMGLGTVITQALLEHAFANGYHQVGWHCWAYNTASGALALRAGFTHRRDYPVFAFRF